MRASADNLLTLHAGIAALDSRLIGSVWFDEGSIIGKAGGIAIRFAKLQYVDVPVEYFLTVVQHEFGGHGARYRELDIPGIHYAFDLPPPYGNGGGEATSSWSGQSPHETIAIWSGGVESHTFLQRGLALRWLDKRVVSYREALMYFISFQIAFEYILDAHENLLDGEADDDPRAFVRLLNVGYGTLTPSTRMRMTVADLKMATKIDLANPFLFYSLYLILYDHLWHGRDGAELPMLRLGSVDYLPLIRSGWTPFGVEYHLENYMRIGERATLIDLRLGDGSFHSGWGGVGVDVQRIFDDGHWRLDAGAKLWLQPSLMSGFNPTRSIGSGLGGAWSVRVYQDIHGLPVSLNLVGELGYKTAGYVEGYPMKATPLLMMGMAVRM